MKIPQDMLECARKVLANAYSPYSKFRVGACIRSANNELFSGCNIENASYSLSICAETAAIAHMVTAGQSQIKEILIITEQDKLILPCGACRQRLSEFCSNDIIIYAVGQSKQAIFKLSELLPFPFNKTFLEK